MKLIKKKNQTLGPRLLRLQQVISMLLLLQFIINTKYTCNVFGFLVVLVSAYILPQPQALTQIYLNWESNPTIKRNNNLNIETYTYVVFPNERMGFFFNRIIQQLEQQLFRDNSKSKSLIIKYISINMFHKTRLVHLFRIWSPKVTLLYNDSGKSHK